MDMMAKTIEQFSKLSSNINKIEYKQYNGIYQWRTRDDTWLFDIQLKDKCTWNINTPSEKPDYKLFINDNDLRLLVNKAIDPLNALNSGKLLIEQREKSKKDSDKHHVQKFLNILFNATSMDEDIKNSLFILNPKANEIPEIPITDSHSEVEHCIQIGSPCVLKNSSSEQWNLSQMTVSDIVSRVGSDFGITLLTAEHDPENSISANYTTSTLSDYIDLLYQEPNKKPQGYMAANSIPEALYDCFDYPPYFAKSAFNIPRWWIGPKNTGLNLHRDLVDNFLYQIKGTKKVYIFSPSESDYLYPAIFGGNPFYEPSSVDMLEPDLTKYPKFSEAKGVCCELCPGDMLYLPAGWWHCIRNLDICWSLNFFAVNQKPVVLNKIKS